MVELKFEIGDTIDNNLDDEWCRSYGSREIGWDVFIKESTQGILSVQFGTTDSPLQTKIVFESEECMNWFLLRWS